MKTIAELNYTQLKNTCSPEDFSFKSTAELKSLEGIIGQERATRAFDFGLEVTLKGYNIYMKPADVVYEFAPPVKAKEVNVSALNLTQANGRFESAELEGNEFVNASVTFNGQAEFTVYDDGSNNYKITADDNFVTLTLFPIAV